MQHSKPQFYSNRCHFTSLYFSGVKRKMTKHGSEISNVSLGDKRYKENQTGQEQTAFSNEGPRKVSGSRADPGPRAASSLQDAGAHPVQGAPWAGPMVGSWAKGLFQGGGRPGRCWLVPVDGVLPPLSQVSKGSEVSSEGN